MSSITKRYLDVKRHTVGYFVGGQRRTVAQTTLLTRRGCVKNARVVGNHVQAQIGSAPLCSLPETVVRD